MFQLILVPVVTLQRLRLMGYLEVSCSGLIRERLFGTNDIAK
jgi:hypothetical protein